jgi:hypothetical protein
MAEGNARSKIMLSSTFGAMLREDPTAQSWAMYHVAKMSSITSTQGRQGKRQHYGHHPCEVAKHRRVLVDPRFWEAEHVMRGSLHEILEELSALETASVALSMHAEPATTRAFATASPKGEGGQGQMTANTGHTI